MRSPKIFRSVLTARPIQIRHVLGREAPAYVGKIFTPPYFPTVIEVEVVSLPTVFVCRDMKGYDAGSDGVARLGERAEQSSADAVSRGRFRLGSLTVVRAAVKFALGGRCGALYKPRPISRGLP